MSKFRYDIVKGLPIPEEQAGRGGGRESVYPFDEMAMGDCIKFEAADKLSDSYRRIYFAARANARRRDSDYDFRFAQIDKRHFGCWKVKREEGERPLVRRKRRTKVELDSITARSLSDALHTEGTLAGAAKRVGLHPITFRRLLRRHGIIDDKQT